MALAFIRSREGSGATCQRQQMARSVRSLLKGLIVGSPETFLPACTQLQDRPLVTNKFNGVRSRSRKLCPEAVRGARLSVIHARPRHFGEGAGSGSPVCRLISTPGFWSANGLGFWVVGSVTIHNRNGRPKILSPIVTLNPA